eukprot:6196796-Pleurochrysis_carterae.AAC.4
MAFQDFEIPRHPAYGSRLKGVLVRDPDGAGDSSHNTPYTRFTRDRSGRDRSLHVVARLCSKERERDLKMLGLATPELSTVTSSLVLIVGLAPPPTAYDNHNHTSYDITYYD